MSNLIEAAKENLQFLGVCLLIIVAIFLIAAAAERFLPGRNSVSPARRVVPRCAFPPPQVDNIQWIPSISSQQNHSPHTPHLK